MKTLIETNPYLIDKENCENSNIRSVVSSCGVEGIVVKIFPGQYAPVNPVKAQEVFNKIKRRLGSTLGRVD